jgi:purine-binding chemotaxis protein CheW
MEKLNANQPLEVLTLDLHGEIFAIDAHSVREILDPVPVTAVPNARPFVGGLINVRGKVVPLADPRVVFGMERAPSTVDTRIVVVEANLNGEATLVGLIADKVYEVTELPQALLEQTPRIGLRWPPELIRCIGKRNDDFIIVLDLNQLLASGGNQRQHLQ